MKPIDNKMKILILGVSGMLGSAVFRRLSEFPEYQVFGTVRSTRLVSNFASNLRSNILSGIDVENHDALVNLISSVRPDILINCVGLVKQLAHSEDPLNAIPINSILPHRLARILALIGGRLIHISTDCVFSGKVGMYKESDVPDASDVYGRTKLLGEVDYENAVTLRTSIIGHEFNGNRSLINWFLSQEGTVKGFSKAVFSGLPTVELANVIHQHVIHNPTLKGLYHVSSDPIDKFSLLKLVAEAYNKKINILDDDSLVIDRSLDSSRFRIATGFKSMPWNDLVISMHNFS